MAAKKRYLFVGGSYDGRLVEFPDANPPLYQLPEEVYLVHELSGEEFAFEIYVIESMNLDGAISAMIQAYARQQKGSPT